MIFVFPLSFTYSIFLILFFVSFSDEKFVGQKNDADVGRHVNQSRQESPIKTAKAFVLQNGLEIFGSTG